MDVLECPEGPGNRRSAVPDPIVVAILYTYASSCSGPLGGFGLLILSISLVWGRGLDLEFAQVSLSLWRQRHALARSWTWDTESHSLQWLRW